MKNVLLSETSLDNLFRGISISTKRIIDGSKTTKYQFYKYRVPQNHSNDEYVNKYVYEQEILEKELDRKKADVIWFTKNNGVLHDLKIPIVSTVYDVISLDRPDLQGGHHTHTRDFVRLSRLIGATMSDAIVVPSQFTKTRIMHHFNVSSNKIKVIPLAADKNVFNLAPLSEKDQKRFLKILPSKYILGVGAFNVHKNFGTLLRAYHASKLKSKGVHLVLVGPKNDKTKGNYLEQLKIESTNLGIDNFVHYLTDVNHMNGLDIVYKKSLFFVNTSQYEGFGIPVLEAMSCGKAVISSLDTAQVEVLGDSALSISANDVEGVASAINLMYESSDLRSMYEGKSIERCRVFDWTMSVKMYEELFEKVSNR